MNAQTDHLPKGLIAQLVQRCLGVAGGEAVQISFTQEFFRVFFRYCISDVHYCNVLKSDFLGSAARVEEREIENLTQKRNM